MGEELCHVECAECICYAPFWWDNSRLLFSLLLLLPSPLHSPSPHLGWMCIELLHQLYMARWTYSIKQINVHSVIIGFCLWIPTLPERLKVGNTWKYSFVTGNQSLPYSLMCTAQLWQRNSHGVPHTLVKEIPTHSFTCSSGLFLVHMTSSPFTLPKEKMD